jgi:hypothetical protein
MRCLEDLKRGWAHYINVDQCVGIEERLRVVLSSDAFRASRTITGSSLVPDNIGVENIRTFNRKVYGEEIFDDEDM